MSRRRQDKAPRPRASAPSTTPHAAVGRASMLSPTLDLLCVGGLSLVVMVPLLLAGRTDLLLVSAGVQAWIGTAINMPHFMASYRLVYGSRAMMLKHKWASMYVPAILLAYMAFALWQAQESQAFVYIMITVASVYLAWHYTGQVWGMMAAYAALEGASFDAMERRLVRTSLRMLLAWHVAWFLYTQLRDPSGVTWIYQVVSAGTVVAFAVGGYGLFPHLNLHHLPHRHLKRQCHQWVMKECHQWVMKVCHQWGMKECHQCHQEKTKECHQWRTKECHQWKMRKMLTLMLMLNQKRKKFLTLKESKYLLENYHKRLDRMKRVKNFLLKM
jgi:hypothetical protein